MNVSLRRLPQNAHYLTVKHGSGVLAKEDQRDKHERIDIYYSLRQSRNATSQTVPGGMSYYTLNMPAQSVKVAETIETAIASRILHTSILFALSFQLNVVEKGTLGLVGAEKFQVALVLLFQKNNSRRRDELVRNRRGREPIALAILSTFVTVVIIVFLQTTLVVFIILRLLSYSLNNALNNLTSNRKYKSLIVESCVFILNSQTTLLIYVN